MTRPGAAVLMLGATLALGACGKPVDPVFGTSYDSCMLRNHGNGGEDDIATQSCARHYVRPATKAEIAGIDAVTTETVGIQVPNIAASIDPKLPLEHHVEVKVNNPSGDFIITDVTVISEFYKTAAMNPKDRIEPDEWDFDKLAVEPGQWQIKYEMFDKNKAPSPFAKSRVTAARVISHAHGLP